MLVVSDLHGAPVVMCMSEMCTACGALTRVCGITAACMAGVLYAVALCIGVWERYSLVSACDVRGQCGLHAASSVRGWCRWHG